MFDISSVLLYGGQTHCKEIFTKKGKKEKERKKKEEEKKRKKKKKNRIKDAITDQSLGNDTEYGLYM